MPTSRYGTLFETLRRGEEAYRTAAANFSLSMPPDPNAPPEEPTTWEKLSQPGSPKVRAWNRWQFSVASDVVTGSAEGYRPGAPTGPVDISKLPLGLRTAQQFDEQGNPINPPAPTPKPGFGGRMVQGLGLLGQDITQQTLGRLPEPVLKGIETAGEIAMALPPTLWTGSISQGARELGQAARAVGKVGRQLPQATREVMATGEVGMARLGREGKIPKVTPATPEVTAGTPLNLGRTQGNRLFFEEMGVLSPSSSQLTISEIVTKLNEIQAKLDKIPTSRSGGPQFRRLDNVRVILLKEAERESGLSETGLRNVAEGLPPPIIPKAISKVEPGMPAAAPKAEVKPTTPIPEAKPTLTLEQFKNWKFPVPEGGASKTPAAVMSWKPDEYETLAQLAKDPDQWRFNEALGKGYTDWPSSLSLRPRIKAGEKITIYRASDVGDIVPGSYVSESKVYAQQHGERSIPGGKFSIYNLDVYPDELVTYGDPHEFLYRPRDIEAEYNRLIGRGVIAKPTTPPAAIAGQGVEAAGVKEAIPVKPPAAEVPPVKPPTTIRPPAEIPPTKPPTLTEQMRQQYADIGDDLQAWKVSLRGLKGEEARAGRLTIKLLEKELGNLDIVLKTAGEKIAPADIRAMRQQVNAIASYKGFTENQLRKIYEQATGQRYLRKMTQVELEKATAAVQKARPITIGNKKVITEKTESAISELRTNLIRQGKLDEDTFKATVRYLKLPTVGYKSKGLFIGEKEGKELLRSLNRQAEIGVIAWDNAVKKALVGKPQLQSAIEDIGKRFTPPQPGKLVGVSPWWSMERYVQKLQERTGKPFFDVFERLRRNWQANLSHIDDMDRVLMESSPEFKSIAKDEQALNRINQYIAAKNKYLAETTGLKSPPDITAEEIKLANAIEKDLFAYQPDVRFSRFYDAYSKYGDDANRIIGDIPNAPKADIRQAIDIYESQGADALSDFLKKKDWGVLKTGFEPHIVINSKLQLHRIKATVVGKGHLQTREGIEFAPQDKNILERLTSYRKQMETLKLESYFKELDRLYQESVPMLKNPWGVKTVLEQAIDEMKGYVVKGVTTRLVMKTGSFGFSVLALAPKMTLRNAFQNMAMHSDFFRFFNLTNRKLTELEMKYLKTYVAEEQGILKDWMMQEGIGTGRMAELVKRVSYFGKGETYLNRFPSMWASVNKAEDALNVYKKTGNISDFIKKSGLQDMLPLEQKRILEMMALPEVTIAGVGKVTGEEAALMAVGERQTIAAHFRYTRALQAPALQGEGGRIVGSLFTYPRGVMEKAVVALSKAGRGTRSERIRATKTIVSMLIGSMVADYALQKMTGRKGAYNPLNVFQWQPGGLAIGAPQQIAETMTDMISVMKDFDDDSAKDRFIKGLTGTADMFIPGYLTGMNIVESLTDTKYLDRRGLRWVRSQLEEDYKPRQSYYETNRDFLQKMQHAIFGGEPPVEPKPRTPTIPKLTPITPRRSGAPPLLSPKKTKPLIPVR